MVFLLSLSAVDRLDTPFYDVVLAAGGRIVDDISTSFSGEYLVFFFKKRLLRP